MAKKKKGKSIRQKNVKNIIDVPLSKLSNKGSGASHGGVDYHYQNYSNILEFFKNLAFGKLCLFEKPYIHLDIAGPTFVKAKYGYRGKGATGMGLRLLYQFIKNRA